MEFGIVSLGLHSFLRLSSAGLIVALVPGCFCLPRATQPQHLTMVDSELNHYIYAGMCFKLFVRSRHLTDMHRSTVTTRY